MIAVETLAFVEVVVAATGVGGEGAGRVDGCDVETAGEQVITGNSFLFLGYLLD